MDEIDQDPPVPVMTVGEKLRDAREAKGLSVEDVAAQTRIPTRHLLSLELGEWDKLPAPTYTMGFAKSYAGAIGLDRQEIGEELRVEMGGVRAAAFQPEVFEPADPKRVMPKGLVFGAIAALVLVAVLLSWLASRDGGDETPATTLNEAAAAPPVEPTPVAAEQVTLTALEAAWVEIKDGTLILKQGELAQGESFPVPANAAAPTLSTAKPEALRIMVGTVTAPAIGRPGAKVDEVSLRPADLLKAPVTATPEPTVAAPVQSRPAPSRPAPRRSAPAAQAPVTTAPAPAPVVTTPPPPATTNSAG